MSDIPAPAETAARALLASAVRHLLVAAGTILVTRGIVTQGQVDGIIPTLVESIVGTLLVAGATGWAQVRAWLAHGRFAAAWAVLNGEDRAAAGIDPDRLRQMMAKPPQASEVSIRAAADAPEAATRSAIGMDGETIPLSPVIAGQADGAGPAA